MVPVSSSDTLSLYRTKVKTFLAGTENFAGGAAEGGMRGGGGSFLLFSPVFSQNFLDEWGLFLYNVGSYGNFQLRKDFYYG